MHMNCGWNGGHRLTPTNSETYSNHIGWYEMKTSYLKQVVVGSRALGLYLPRQRSILNWACLSGLFCFLFSSTITRLWNDRVIPLFPDPSGRSLPADHKTKEPLIVVLSPTYHLYALCVFIVNYSIPTNVKWMCVSSFYYLSSLRDFPALLSPTSFNLPTTDFM